MNTAFRGEYNIYGYQYGVGEREACIVGAMRGNEYQQLYICSLLSQKLAALEAGGHIVSGKSILIIPSLNYSSMNSNHKFWLSDDTDINRSFPGNPYGTATSRIASFGQYYGSLNDPTNRMRFKILHKILNRLP